MAIYEQHDVVRTPTTRATAVTRDRRSSPGQVVSGLLGFVLVVMGVVAVTRCGIDSSLNTPPTDILGMAHSSWVGIVEIVAGLLLVVSAADEAFRGVAGAVGVILFLAGVVVAAGTDRMLLQIGTERATGWFAMSVGAIAIVASMLPTFHRSERYVSSDGPSV